MPRTVSPVREAVAMYSQLRVKMFRGKVAVAETRDRLLGKRLQTEAAQRQARLASKMKARKKAKKAAKARKRIVDERAQRTISVLCAIPADLC